MISRFCLQLTTLLSLLLGNICVGLLPLCIVRLISRNNAGDQDDESKKNRRTSFLIHFGGGIFLTTCLLILIPESQKLSQKDNAHLSTGTDEANLLAEDIFDGEHDHGFPVPEFVVLCGFFGTFAVQEFIKCVFHLCRRKNIHPEPRVRFCSCAKRHTECSRTFKAENPDQTIFGLEKQKYLESISAPLEGECSNLHRNAEKVANVNTSLLQSSIISQPVPRYGSVTNMAEPPTNQTLPVLSSPVVIANDGKVTIIHREKNQSSEADTMSNILLLIVLSLYGVIEGISFGHIIGYLPWSLLLVNCLQQTIIIFVVGSAVLPDSLNLWPVVGYVGTLSAMYSLGICITTFWEEEVLSISNMVLGIIRCGICGSLLYLIFCDLFRRDSLRKTSGGEKFIGFTLGATTVVVLIYLSTIL